MGIALLPSRLHFMKNNSLREFVLWFWPFTAQQPIQSAVLLAAEGHVPAYVSVHRATTYYLADRRYDMLPSILSADLCSLLGGVDR